MPDGLAWLNGLLYVRRMNNYHSTAAQYQVTAARIELPNGTGSEEDEALS